MKPEKLFRERLKNILDQLTSDQIEELFETLLQDPRFIPEGYPNNWELPTFDELSDEQVKYLHDKFIDIQYSANPELQGEDIRGVIIYPYRSQSFDNT